MLIAGCTAAGSASTATQLSQAVPSSTPASTPPELLASVASGAAAVAPGDPITVAAVHGAINEVKLVDAAGTPVAGATDVSATKWTSSSSLDYGKNYTL
ncbi:MAG: Ig-like domain-containing protein, partial [Mycobacteriaceae bacterium]